MKTADEIAARIAGDLAALGIRTGDVVLVHASLRSLGPVPGGAETVVQGFLRAIGEAGTLLMPALSYEQQPHHLHDTRHTPSNVGALAEYFRQRPGTVRSVHPTHSVCGIGPAVPELFRRHALDTTPCGPNSPFNLMSEKHAQIVMLGCGLRPNTTMHALEEYVNPPYLLGDTCVYTITDAEGRTYQKRYRRHGFFGWVQRYDRLAGLAEPKLLRSGRVLAAETWVIDSAVMKRAVLQALARDRFAFVDRAAGAGS